MQIIQTDEEKIVKEDYKVGEYVPRDEFEDE